jgi:hypothetical protein
LRVALIFHETRRRMGRPLRLTIGEPVTAEALSQIDRGDIARDLGGGRWRWRATSRATRMRCSSGPRM